MAAIGARQIDALGEAREAEDHAPLPAVDTALVLRQNPALAFRGLAQHPLEKGRRQGRTDLIKLAPGGKDHQRALVLPNEAREQFGDFRRVGLALARIAAQLRHY